MSEKTKWPADEAMNVAIFLMRQLSPVCEQITIAGSLRRGKKMVGDVELLFIPKYDEQPDGFFDKIKVNLAEQKIQELLNRDVLTMRPNVNGGFSWGRENKLAIHRPSGIPVDLFSTSPEKWWVALVIRTGSKETNMRLTTGANYLNRTLNAYGVGVTDRKTGEIIPATSEQHVFELCGVPFIEPEERTF